MAKVINPLLSGSASGQLGHMMTFDKRGFVRQYVVPSNPKTVNQMAVRDTMGDLQRFLKLLGTKLRGELKAGLGYRWNSMIIGELMATDNASLIAYTAEFTAFTGGEKTAWEGVDVANPIKLTLGACAYSCMSAAYDIASRLGATITLTLPDHDTAAASKAEWVAAAA
jgi:hypothetical protein